MPAPRSTPEDIKLGRARGGNKHCHSHLARTLHKRPIRSSSLDANALCRRWRTEEWADIVEILGAGCTYSGKCPDNAGHWTRTTTTTHFWPPCLNGHPNPCPPCVFNLAPDLRILLQVNIYLQSRLFFLEEVTLAFPYKSVLKY